MQTVEDRWNEQGTKGKIKLKLYKSLVMQRNLTPFSLLRSFGRFLSPFFIKKHAQYMTKGGAKTEVSSFSKYLYQVCMLPGSGEYALTKIFDEVLFAYHPVFSDIDELRTKVDVSFFYGTRDWMDLRVGHAMSGPPSR